MIQVLAKNKVGDVTLEMETVFIVRGKGMTSQYDTPIDAVFEFGIRTVSSDNKPIENKDKC